MMRSAFITVTAAVLLGATATAAPALTDLEIFERKVRAYATPSSDIFDKSKGLCVCINDPENTTNNGMAGVLDVDTVTTVDPTPIKVRVRCMVMKAGPDGGIGVAQSCETFVPLAK
jgi:hypothetical protein